MEPISLNRLCQRQAEFRRTAAMPLAPSDITIAVTMYRRLEYIENALRSAVEQTRPVKVVLYDDGCQDVGRLQHILQPFGSRVQYRRNPKTLGLFQNMNRCIEECDTAWLSILHDDDALAPDFVERVVATAAQVDGATLFFGGTTYLTDDGRPFHQSTVGFPEPWREIPLEDFALKNWFAFPGQLMHARTARAAGGFPVKSIYTGDWDLWFRLALQGRAIQINAQLGLHRTHLGADRGTTQSAKTGRRTACSGMQAKRNVGRLRRLGRPVEFERERWLAAYAPQYRNLLVYAWQMPRWLLRYNRKLMMLTTPTGRASRLLHIASLLGGTPALRLAGLARTVATRAGVSTPPTF